jgi:tetratricopeptide (TPR) repeat protein
MKARARLVLVLIVVVGGGGPVATAAAGGPERPGRARFEMAETKFNLGRFEEAAVDYQAAYEAEPLPAFLFNIGQCYRNVGDHERAQFYFRRYVELDPRSPNRPDAERLIAEMERLAAGQRSTAVPALAPAGLTGLPPSRAGTGGADEHAPAFAPAIARGHDAAATPRPLYRRPWFWVGGAVVVAAVIAGAVIITRDDHQPSLQPIDTR